jgi:uroporphyrinogen decarboxylase
MHSMKALTRRVLSSSTRLALPILTFPGGRLIGASVREMVHDSRLQSAAQLRLRDRFPLSALLSAMDLSAEAEEFGAAILFSDDEVPTVTGRLVSDLPSIEALRVPAVGSRRTRVYLETIENLAKESGGLPVLAGLIGPFSLAGRLLGVSEALLATASEGETLERLLAKTTRFLIAYAKAFKEAGADGVIMAEPAAGLMSPDSAARYSSSYIRAIIDAVEDDAFQVVLHNCGARLGHLLASLESRATMLHFGKPMDLEVALSRAGSETVLCGNLDPSEIFVHSRAAEVAARTAQLLERTAAHKNFVISSGCDIPSAAPLENLQAFFETLEQFNRR